MICNFKVIQKKEKKQWQTHNIINGSSVPFMLIDDLSAKLIYGQKSLKIVKDVNGIIVYYDKYTRAVYTENPGEIV